MAHGGLPPLADLELRPIESPSIENLKQQNEELRKQNKYLFQEISNKEKKYQELQQTTSTALKRNNEVINQLQNSETILMKQLDTFRSKFSQYKNQTERDQRNNPIFIHLNTKFKKETKKK